MKKVAMTRGQKLSLRRLFRCRGGKFDSGEKEAAEYVNFDRVLLRARLAEV